MHPNYPANKFLCFSCKQEKTISETIDSDTGMNSVNLDSLSAVIKIEGKEYLLCNNCYEFSKVLKGELKNHVEDEPAKEMMATQDFIVDHFTGR